jgi:hypothetical protein
MSNSAVVSHPNPLVSKLVPRRLCMGVETSGDGQQLRTATMDIGSGVPAHHPGCHPDLASRLRRGWSRRVDLRGTETGSYSVHSVHARSSIFPYLEKDAIFLSPMLYPSIIFGVRQVVTVRASYEIAGCRARIFLIFRW